MSRYPAAPEEDKESLLDLVSKGMSLRSAQAKLGYDNKVYQRWKEKDPEYAERLEAARQAGIGAHESNIDKYIFGDGDLNGAKSNLMMFRLKQMDPSYRESAPPVQFNINVEHKAIDMGAVARVLKEANADLDLEAADDERAIPEHSEILSSRPGGQS